MAKRRPKIAQPRVEDAAPVAPPPAPVVPAAGPPVPAPEAPEPIVRPGGRDRPPEEASVFDVMTEPLGARAATYMARQVPLESNVQSALMAIRAKREADRQQAMQRPGAAPPQEEVGLPEAQGPTALAAGQQPAGGSIRTEWPLAKAPGLAMGVLGPIVQATADRDFGVLGKALLGSDKGTLGAETLAAKNQMREETLKRLGKPKWWGERLAIGGRNLATDLWDVASMVPSVIAQTTLPQVAPPGAQQEDLLDQQMRLFQEGQKMGRKIVGGAGGGTLDILEHPLESLEARPVTTVATYVPFLRGAIEATRMMRAANMARKLPPMPEGLATKGLPEQPPPPEGPTAPPPMPGEAGGVEIPTAARSLPTTSAEALKYPLENLPGDLVDVSVRKLGEALRKAGLRRGAAMPQKMLDGYMRMFADGFYAGDPMMTAIAEEVGRGTERGDMVIDAMANEIAGAAMRDIAKKKGVKAKAPVVPEAPPAEAPGAPEAPPAEAPVVPEAPPAEVPPAEPAPMQPRFEVRQQRISGGKPSGLEFPTPETRKIAPITAESMPETHPVMNEYVDTILDMANIAKEDPKAVEFRPAIKQDAEVAFDNMVGDDNKSNWKGQFLSNADQFHRDYIAAAEAKVGRSLTVQEQAGLLESLDKQSIDKVEAPRTGLETKGPQELVHAEEVYNYPGGEVAGMKPERAVGMTERAAASAHKQVMARVKTAVARARSAATAKVSATLKAEKALEAAQTNFNAEKYHRVGDADMASNAKQVADRASATHRLAKAEVERLAPKAARAEEAALAAEEALRAGTSDAAVRQSLEAASTRAKKLTDAANKLETDGVAENARRADMVKAKVAKAEAAFEEAVAAVKNATAGREAAAAEKARKLFEAADRIRREAADDAAMRDRHLRERVREIREDAGKAAAEAENKVARGEESLADKAKRLRAESDAAQQNLADVINEANRTAKEAKVRAAEAATAKARLADRDIKVRNAGDLIKRVQTRLNNLTEARDVAVKTAEALEAKLEKVKVGPQKLPERRLAVTRVVPTIDGIPLDPAELVPPRELTPQEFRTGMQESLKRVADRYRGPSTMEGRLEVEGTRAMQKGMADIDALADLTPEELESSAANNFLQSAKDLTARTPAPEIMTNEPNRALAQKKLAATAYGIAKGFVDGDAQPATLPQGMRAVDVANVIRRSADSMGLTAAEKSKLLRLAYEIGGYVPLSEAVKGVGTPANPVWVHPLIGKAIEYKYLNENPLNTGWFRVVNNMLKSNVTTKSLKGGINNLVPNLADMSIQGGTTPIHVLAKGWDLLHDLHRWNDQGPSAVSMVLDAAFKHGKRTGALSQDFLTKELKGMRSLSPAQRLRMNPFKAWILDPATDFKIDKFTEWFYQHGDQILRLQTYVDQFEQRAQAVAEMRPGTHFDVFPSRRTMQRIGRSPDGRYFAIDPFAKEAAARKPRWLTTDEVLDLVGKDSSRRATFIVGDYGDLTQFNSFMKSAGLDGLISLFTAWASTASDFFGKKGLMYNTLLRNPNAVSTNSLPALKRSFVNQMGVASRKAAMINGLQNKLRAEGSNGPIANAFRSKSSSDQRVIINQYLTALGSYVEGMPLLQWGQVGPTGDWLGFLANMAALPQIQKEYGEAALGKLSQFGEAVMQAESGGDFTRDQFLRLLQLSGGPLGELFQMTKENRTTDEIAARISESFFGGTKVALMRSLMGYLSDPGWEEHPRLPPGEVRDFMAKFSGREREVTEDPNTSMPLLMSFMKQLVGKAFQVKDIRSTSPGEIKSIMNDAKRVWSKSIGATSEEAIEKEAERSLIGTREGLEERKKWALNKAMQKLYIKNAIDNTINEYWKQFVEAYQAMTGKALPPEDKVLSIEPAAEKVKEPEAEEEPPPNEETKPED